MANVEFLSGGFLTYRHEGAPLDCIVSQIALHHLPDFWKQIALLRMAGLLAEGGKLCLRDVVYSFDPVKHGKFLDEFISKAAEKAGPQFARSICEHVRNEYSTMDWIMRGMIERYYRSSYSLCLRYAKRLLADGAKAKAQEVAEEGVAIFEDHLTKELRDFLSGIYKDSDPKKYRDTLQTLFLQSGDWQYYGPLKKACQPEEWQERLGMLLAHFAENRSADWSGRSKLIDIYLKEKMYDQALTEVLAKRSLSTLRQYQNDLAFRYPEQYFNVYRELIIPFANKDMGRKHYQEVVSYLKRMKSIEGYEGAVSEIVGRLRIEHKRKPAFIDEMKVL